MRPMFLRGQACLFHFHFSPFPSPPPPHDSLYLLAISLSLCRPFSPLFRRFFWSVQLSGFLPLRQLCAAQQSLAYWLSRTGSSEIPLIKDRARTQCLSQHTATYAPKSTDRMNSIEAELREVKPTMTNREGDICNRLAYPSHWRIFIQCDKGCSLGQRNGVFGNVRIENVKLHHAVLNVEPSWEDRC